jgi:tetratricopeptide (TPR) repeat protein
MERNTGDKNWADQFAVTATKLAMELNTNQRGSDAIAMVREAGAAIDRLLKDEPKRHRYRYLAANNRLIQGDLYIDLNQLADASEALRDAARRLDEVIKDEPDDFYTVESKVSALADQVIVEHRLGNVARARVLCQQALDLAASLIRKDPAVRDSITATSKLRRESKALGLSDSYLASGASR